MAPPSRLQLVLLATAAILLSAGTPYSIVAYTRRIVMLAYWKGDAMAHTLAKRWFWTELNDLVRTDVRVWSPSQPFRGYYVRPARPLQIAANDTHHIVLYTSEGSYFGQPRSRIPESFTCIAKTWKGENASILVLKDWPGGHSAAERNLRVFHAADWKSVRVVKSLERDVRDLFVLWNMESPVNMRATLDASYMRQFDMLMGYRHDAAIHTPYLSFENHLIAPLPLNSTALWHARKQSGVLLATAVSNCNDFAGRSFLVSALSARLHSRFVNIGKCHRTARLPDGASLEGFASRAFFYLAIENSNCEDYVTEKLRRALAIGAVPVVFAPPQSLAGGADDVTPVPDYASMLPPHTFINIADHESIDALIAHLERVAADRRLYTRYLWTHGTSLDELRSRWKKDIEASGRVQNWARAADHTGVHNGTRSNAGAASYTASRIGVNGRTQAKIECEVAIAALQFRPNEQPPHLTPDESCLPPGQLCRYLPAGTCTAGSVDQRIGPQIYPLKAMQSR